MRVTRLSGSEGGGILCDSPYPYSDSTLFPTEASSSSTADTSSLLAPDAARCSGRVRTDSYSSIKGTDKSKSNRRARAASSTWRDAPMSLRKAATSTSVSKTYAFITHQDIACDIACQV